MPKNISPHKGRNKVRKHGISALQFWKNECSDTQLARGFFPLNPEQQKGKINRTKQLEKRQKFNLRFTPSKLGVLCTQELCKQYTMLAEGNFPIPLSKQDQKIGTISQKKYDAYKVKNHTQQALHIVIQKPVKLMCGKLW